MIKKELRILWYQTSRISGMITKLQEEITEMTNQLAAYQNPDANEIRKIKKDIKKLDDAKQNLIRKRRSLRNKQIFQSFKIQTITKIK